MDTRHSQAGTVERRLQRKTKRTTGRTAEIKTEVRLDMPQAHSVAVAGTFNHWDPNQTTLSRDERGVWKTTILLWPGRYEYRFIVDGQWVSDPRAKESVPNPFGSTNSVLMV